MHHAKRVHCYILQEQKQTHTVRLSHIISCLLYLFRVSDALGYTRNNSECLNFPICLATPSLHHTTRDGMSIGKVSTKHAKSQKLFAFFSIMPYLRPPKHQEQCSAAPTEQGCHGGQVTMWTDLLTSKNIRL